MRDLYQNISFVYWRAGFVLHVASRGDKVRVTRSTLGRNRKCCCEHQLLLIGRAGQRVVWPSQARPNKATTVSCKTFFFFFKSSKRCLRCTSRNGCILLAIKWLKVAFRWNIICTALQHVVNVESTFVSCRGRGSGSVSHVRGFAPGVSDTFANERRLPETSQPHN